MNKRIPLLKKEKNEDTRFSFVLMSALSTCMTLLVTELIYMTLTFVQNGNNDIYYDGLNSLLKGLGCDFTIVLLLALFTMYFRNKYITTFVNMLYLYSILILSCNFVLKRYVGTGLNKHMIYFLFHLNANDLSYLKVNIIKVAINFTTLIRMIIPGIAMALYCYISYVLILKIKGIIEKKFFVTFNGNNVNNNNNRDQYRKTFFIRLLLLSTCSFMFANAYLIRQPSSRRTIINNGILYHYKGLSLPANIMQNIFAYNRFKTDQQSSKTIFYGNRNIRVTRSEKRRLNQLFATTDHVNEMEDDDNNEPNIIYIVMESVGIHNIDIDHMPYFKSLSSSSSSLDSADYTVDEFTKMYTESPNTLKSMIQLLCGKDVIYDSIGWDEYEKYNLKECLPSYLTNNYNFTTGIFTPVDLNTHRVGKKQRRDLGFQYEFTKNDMKEYNINENKKSNDFQLIEPSVDWMLRQTEKKKSFFASVFPSMTHAPYVSITEDKEGMCKEHINSMKTIKYDHLSEMKRNNLISTIDSKPDNNKKNSNLKLYNNALHCLDFWLKSYIEKLHKQPFFKNTIIAIVGDHGESFGNNQHYFHGGSVSEEQIHVPFKLISYHYQNASNNKMDTDEERERNKISKLKDKLWALSDIPYKILFNGFFLNNNNDKRIRSNSHGNNYNTIIEEREMVQSYAFFNPNIKSFVYNTNFKLVVDQSREDDCLENNIPSVNCFKLYNLLVDKNEENNILKRIMLMPNGNNLKQFWIAEIQRLIDNPATFVRSTAMMKKRRLAAGDKVRVANAAESGANGDYVKYNSVWRKTTNSITYEISYSSNLGQWRLRKQGSSTWSVLNTNTASGGNIPPSSGWSGSMTVEDVSDTSSTSSPSPSSSSNSGASSPSSSESAYTSPSPSSFSSNSPSPSSSVYNNGELLLSPSSSTTVNISPSSLSSNNPSPSSSVYNNGVLLLSPSSSTTVNISPSPPEDIMSNSNINYCNYSAGNIYIRILGLFSFIFIVMV